MAHPAFLAAVNLCLVVATGCGGVSSTSSSSPPPPPPPAPDCQIAVQPLSLSVVLGLSNQIQITVAPLNGFTGTVSLNANSLPAGVTVSPALPQNIGPSGLSLSVEAVVNGVAGTYAVPLSASSGSLQHSSNPAFTPV